MEDSYHLLSYKDWEQLKHFWVSKSPVVKSFHKLQEPTSNIAITEKKYEQ